MDINPGYIVIICLVFWLTSFVCFAVQIFTNLFHLNAFYSLISLSFEKQLVIIIVLTGTYSLLYSIQNDEFYSIAFIVVLLMPGS